MQHQQDGSQPLLSPEETEYVRRRQEEGYWVERHDRILDLETRWAFIRSRSPDREGPGLQCQHVADGRTCTRHRAAGASQFAHLPLHCRFHLLKDFAGDLALLLREDPEKVSEHYSIGCLRLLMEERLHGGPTAQEAQEALKAICDALLNWPPAGQRQQAEER